MTRDIQLCQPGGIPLILNAAKGHKGTFAIRFHQRQTPAVIAFGVVDQAVQPLFCHPIADNVGPHPLTQR